MNNTPPPVLEHVVFDVSGKAVKLRADGSLTFYDEKGEQAHYLDARESIVLTRTLLLYRGYISKQARAKRPS